MNTKTIEKKTVCLNCGNTFEGAFCPECGQKAKTKRLGIHEIVVDFVNSFVGSGDNKFLNTCRGLCCRPGYMVRDFLLGKRADFHNPLRLYIYLLTIYAVVSYVLGISSSLFDDIADMDFDMDEEDMEYASIGIVIGYIKELYSNKLYGTLFTAFLAIFPCRLLTYKCRIERADGSMLPLNLTEHFYTRLFLSCIKMLITLAFLPINFIDGAGGIELKINHIAYLIFTIILYRQLLGIGWIKSILLTLLAYLLTLVLLTIVIALAFAVAMLMEKM